MQPRPAINAGHRMPRGGDHCDFCGAVPVARLYACANYEWRGVNVFIDEDGGRWAACSACAVLIDAGRWGQLTQRVMRQVVKRKGLEPEDAVSLRSGLRELHKGFAAHLIDEGKALQVHNPHVRRVAVGDD